MIITSIIAYITVITFIIACMYINYNVIVAVLWWPEVLRRAMPPFQLNYIAPQKICQLALFLSALLFAFIYVTVGLINVVRLRLF